MNLIKRKWMIVLTIVALSSMGIWSKRFTLTKFYYMKNFFQKSPESLIRKFEKDINDDREILSRYELFNESFGTLDAGPFLNTKVRWEIGQIPHPGELALPKVIHRELAQDWTSKKPLFKKMDLNFSWMKKILSYDVWSLELKSPAYPLGQEFDTFTYPVPTYKDLMTWSKLRYLYAKETGDIQTALKEVRHLMRLIWTNDNLTASMAVINLLKIENQFLDTVEPVVLKDWNSIPHDHIMRASRYFYSLPGFSDIRLRDETFHKYTLSSVGKCLMMNESLAIYLSMRDYLLKELHYGMERMAEFVRYTRCRKSYVISKWLNLKPEASLKLNSSGIILLGKSHSQDEIQKNPDLKASVGYIEASLMGWGYFSYGDN